ncbi:AraC family transcriptional regulator [Burkholderia sp. MSh2]|uniref:AraC family transcriptional regulator n=1 Tax=Burkholderia paludis TaxID=1506587 RepID=A0A6P2HX98_9BURK|nr:MULTISPECIES: helix-turn-helix transcriptional regulator [Burkholderia]KEZ01378.1 AraC family transcriptional regulator [Burkholderia sp. MSh2]KFG92459.1 AraC family transcriptional regulator [Burkholderia paludis]CAB3745776.1 HTH-type transcriptional activator RhaR [Burkholderia paludis]VWB21586.1 AraC family transcriptional regulator [Burkholderia paludis]
MTAQTSAAFHSGGHRHAAHVARIREVRPGLCIHADDATDELDAVMSGQCTPGLHLVLLLEGALDVSYGDRRVVLTTDGRRASRAAPPPSLRMQSFLLNAVQPDTFRRRLSKGGYARRVSLAMSGEWLGHLQAASRGALPERLDAMLSAHLAIRFWQPTPRATALAEQIVRPPTCQPMLQAIYLESRVLELLAEAFAPLEADAQARQAADAALGSRDYRRMAELRAFLASDAAQDLSLDDIARHAGMSANAMQRQFRAAYGTTVFDFIREHHLQRARLALERDAVSVKQAAALAGYTSAANFATAYKRRFGVTPTLARRSDRR